MFITHLSVVAANSAAAPRRVPAQLVNIADVASEEELRSAVSHLADSLYLTVDTATWHHHEPTRQGSVSLQAKLDQAPEDSFVLVTWGYDPLDDVDLSPDLAVPVDHRSDALGALTPQQVESFWLHVDKHVAPFELFDDMVRRMGLTPREHDEQDAWVMRYVLALEWWRTFPTVEAGGKALALNPILTKSVVAQVALMASRCFLEGSEYELADVLVYP